MLKVRRMSSSLDRTVVWTIIDPQYVGPVVNLENIFNIEKE